MVASTGILTLDEGNALRCTSAAVFAAVLAVGAGIHAIDTTHRSVVRFAGDTAAPTVVAGGFADPTKMVVDRYNNV